MILIITVFAALAIPSAVVQMRDRRVQESARRIALMFRQARLRALGRGAAILVRFDGTAFTVHEARLGTLAPDANCADLPVSSCLNTLWGSTAQRIVDGHAEATSGDMSNVSLRVVDSANTAVAKLEVCFTPMGRAFVREDNNDATAFAPLDETYEAVVSRPGMTRTRRVVLMPNGTARLASQ